MTSSAPSTRFFSTVAMVADRAERDAFRKRLLDLFELLRDALRHGPAVLADQQHSRAEHDLLAVDRGGTRPQIGAFLDLSDVQDADRDAVARTDDDLADLLDVRHLPRRTDEILLAILFDVAGADVVVVVRERRHDVAEAELVGHQLGRIRKHVELLLEAADRVDLVDAGDVPELGLDDPVLHGPQVARREWLAVGAFRALLRLDGVHVDLAEAGRDRSHRRLDAGRQGVLDPLNAFVDELTGEIDVGPVLEYDGDLAEAVARERARVDEVRQAGHPRLDREGDALLDLKRREPRSVGIDLHLDVGDVRHGIDRKAREVPDAEGAHHEHADHDQPALMDGERKKLVDHVRIPDMTIPCGDP